jgi:hypothetical protein
MLDGRVSTPGRTSEVIFSLCHRGQTGFGAHPTSFSVGTRDSFPGGKASGAYKADYLSPIRLEGVVLI